MWKWSYGTRSKRDYPIIKIRMKEDKQLVETIKSVLSNKRALDVLKREVSHSTVINFTINVVIKEWDNKYSKEDLFQPNIRGEVVVARNTIIVVANKLTLLNARDLYKHVDELLPLRTVRRILCEFRELDSKNKFDKITIDRTEKILEIVVSGLKSKK